MVYKKTPRQNDGFTLIEILVTITILGVMAAVATPSFFTWLNGKKIDDVLAQVDGALKEGLSTAVKKSRKCTLKITAEKVTAIKIDPATNVETPDLACLPTGEREFQLGSNANIGVVGTGGGNSTTMIISPKGSTPYNQTSEAIVVYQKDLSSSNKMKCLVISSGIGIIRMGYYTATTVPSIPDLAPYPASVDPDNPTATEIAAQTAWQTTKDARQAAVDGVINNCVSPL